MLVIGVGNKAQHGKSSFCATIVEICSRAGMRCGEYSISSAILRFAILEGLIEPGTTREQCDPNLLVKIGSEQRAKDKLFWVNQLKEMILADSPSVALIPNVRFPTEQDLVKELGGFNVRVTRLNADGSPFVSQDRDSADPCETALDGANWDFEVRNMSGKPYWLRRQAIALYEYLREGAE